ncbi:MAG: glycosyltransferase family 2 protein [Saprospiraceae bacterium]|nr:glycosyltransferase family 2 protein [Saprospiraceae bacterium]MCB0626345.1 glycosyltransferase family 2 protein [Saprospiraceae bacterium]MCB0677903.1 glycosyltransferase family 2 protein [Saprospiraceae bacterium]MCB0679532.1 glycosyltransferase family 2 protein [Saprospiraceae bacterium]
MDISVIIPVYNEEENLPVLYERLKKVLHDQKLQHELLFVNDGSQDASLERIHALAARDPAVKYIDFSRNFGHQIAVTAGLESCRGKAVVIMDADLQDPPEVVPELYAKWKEGYEVVAARRRARQGESVFKRSTAALFYRLLSRLTSVQIPVDTGDFRIIDRRVVEVLRRMPESHKFLRGQIAWIGFRQTTIEYDRAERLAGQTGYTFRKMLRLALDGITGFSDLPLKAVTYFGILVTVFAFFMTLYVLYSRYILEDYVQGWSSLMISVLFLGGVQMIAIGIIGEYLSRMNDDVRKRPLYIVRDTNL